MPAGLGVLEAVFVTMLGSTVGQGMRLAALLAYRALHHLVPLAVAAAMLGFVGRAGSGAAPHPRVV